MTNFTAVLGPGQTMHDGDTVTSTLGFYKAINSSGNLILKRVSDGSVVYSTGTGGHLGAVCTMVSAGRFGDFYRGHLPLFFKSFTTHPKSSMEVTDDGHDLHLRPGWQQMLGQQESPLARFLSN